METDRTNRNLLGFAFSRILKAAICLSFVFLIVSALLITLALRIVSRISISSQTVTSAASDAVIVTLAKGSFDQKLQMIQVLEKMGADAMPFAAALAVAAKQGDPSVHAAAIHALEVIDPDAAKE